MAARKRNQETSLSAAIRNVLTAKGARLERVQSGVMPMMYGAVKRYVHGASNGTPDIIVVYPRAVWLEVKTKTGKLSDDQKAWHSKPLAPGMSVVVVRSISEAVDAVFGDGKARVE